MFHSSSSSYNDPAFCCSAGPPSLTGTLNPYAAIPSSTTTPSSSLPSDDYFMHRSSSTHSFTHHHHHLARSVADNSVGPFFSSSPLSSVGDDFHHDPVRRVFSTGDLQGMNCLPASTETGMQEAAAGRAVRYSTEERMKRIERYRSKRNQRNFHKKITYACRKTLADSRPRVRGRFARNGETEPEPEPEPSELSCESYNKYNNSNNSYTSYNNHENCYDNYHGNDNCDAADLWRQMQVALTTTDEEDKDLWASIDSVFSMNLLS